MWTGFFSVEVAPSPKVQDQEDASVEVSVNATASGASPDVVFAAKPATGLFAGSGSTMLSVVMIALSAARVGPYDVVVAVDRIDGGAVCERHPVVLVAAEVMPSKDRQARSAVAFWTFG